MAKVAIVGSCITRDLWPIRGDSVADLLYVSRTSLPSLFAPPVRAITLAAGPPADLRGHQHRALLADLDKTGLARLVAFEPTHVIFDFIDERFDLLAVGEALATESWELRASGYLSQPAFRDARPVPRLSGACEQLWLAAAGQFAAFVRATPLCSASLILHSARWAQTRQDAEGVQRPLTDVEVLPGRPVEIAAHNRLLAHYEAAFTSLMPPLAVVQAPSFQVADETHKWGLSPFHYVEGYYREIRDQLANLGISARGDAAT